MINILLKTPGRDDARATAANLSGVRLAMFEYQYRTESNSILAVDADTGEKYARLRFEWVDMDEGGKEY